MSDRKPAVAEDRTLNYTSVSAVKKFDSCETAWWYRYVMRLPDPAGAGARESDECHKRVEHYLKTGENVLGPIELRALKRGLFPTPGPILRVEEYWEGLEADGVPFIVKIDCVDPRPILALRSLVIINDWKFKKSIRTYGTTAKRLCDPTDEDGIQMIGYGEALRRAMARGAFPRAETIRLRHVQVDKTIDDANEVFVDVLTDDFQELFAGIARRLPWMKQTALAKAAEEIDPPEEKPCFKYGGCAFRERCPHFKSKESRSFRLKGLFTPKGDRSAVVQTAVPHTERTMGMLSKMTSKPVANTVPAAVVSAPTPPPAPKSLIIDESTTPDAVLKAAQAAQAAAAQAAPVAQVLPNDAPKSTGATVQAALAAPAPEQAAPIAEQSTKRRRRTAAEIAAANATATPAPTPAQTTMTVPLGGFVLYIGCASRKVLTKPLSPYVDELEKIALAGFKEQLKLELDDIRLATGSEVGFGKWKAVLAQLAKESPPAPGAYTVLGLGIDERVDAVVGALEGLAVDVVSR